MTAREQPEQAPRPVFLLRIEGKPGRAVRDLRNLLKRLLRDHHFRCLDAREAKNTPRSRRVLRGRP